MQHWMKEARIVMSSKMKEGPRQGVTDAMLARTPETSINTSIETSASCASLGGIQSPALLEV